MADVADKFGNKPKTIARLLRAFASGTATPRADAAVFAIAADLLDPPPSDVIPLFYVKGQAIFQRPTRRGDNVTMGFCVCEVCDGVDPAEVCAILNKGEPATEG